MNSFFITYFLLLITTIYPLNFFRMKHLQVFALNMLALLMLIRLVLFVPFSFEDIANICYSHFSFHNELSRIKSIHTESFFLCILLIRLFNLFLTIGFLITRSGRRKNSECSFLLPEGVAKIIWA